MGPGAPAADPRHGSGLIARAGRATGTVLVAIAVVVPSALFAGWLPGLEAQHADLSAAPDQEEPSAVTLTDDVRRAAAGLSEVEGIPVLSYHDLSTRDSTYSVAPALFAEHMAALDLAGFETVTVDQVARYLDGDASGLPARPVLLTFDDGPDTTWTVADPILERHGYTGVAYLITSLIDPSSSGYYLNDAAVQAMLDSGRWELGAHTDDAHHDVTSSLGDGPALLNREGEEDIEAWERRIEDDLATNAAALEAITGEPPSSFTFPFSAYREPTNDRRIPDRLADAVADQFPMSFLAHRLPQATSVRSGWLPYELPRLTIVRRMSAAGLLRELAFMLRPAPDAALEDVEWDDPALGRCDRVARAVVATPRTGRASISCRSLGHGPFAAPAGLRATAHLPSEEATASLRLTGRRIAVEVSVEGTTATLQWLVDGRPREITTVALPSYAPDVRLWVAIDGAAVNAMVGDVRLGLTLQPDEATRHLRLEGVELGGVTDDGPVMFTDLAFRRDAP